jgi:hypothetical protein
MTDEQWEELKRYMPEPPPAPPPLPATEFSRRQQAHLDLHQQTGSFHRPNLDWQSASRGMWRPVQTEPPPPHPGAPQQGSANIQSLHDALVNRPQSHNPGLRNVMYMPGGPPPPEPPSDLDRANAQKAWMHRQGKSRNEPSGADTIR